MYCGSVQGSDSQFILGVHCEVTKFECINKNLVNCRVRVVLDSSGKLNSAV